MKVSKLYNDYTPVNDYYLLETGTAKIKDTEYDTSDSGIFLGRDKKIDEGTYIGTIVKKGTDCPDFEIGTVINFYPGTGTEHTFEDKDTKFLLIKSANFLGEINAV